MSIIRSALLLASASSTPWAFVAAGAVGTGVNPIAVLPTGHLAGDLLVIIGSSSTAFTNPGGWSVADVVASGSARLSVYYKIDSGAESNVTLTNASSKAVAGMVAYRNINASPLDVLGTETTTLTTTSLTTLIANDLVVSCYAISSNAGTWTTPASTTLRISTDATAALNGFLLVDENKTTAGATSTRTATQSAGGGTLASFAVAFKQA